MQKRNKGEAKNIVSVKKQPKQVCILGTAETMGEAPFDDKTWDMWSVASVLNNPAAKRLDRVLELHERDSWGKRIDEINNSKVPVWMWKHYDEIPLSEPFPLEGLSKFRKYFTNSISFLIAQAIVEGYTDIGLFGVHMATTTEYSHQRPSCEYFLGYAEALGINLWIPDGADILKSSRMYGFEPAAEVSKKLNALHLDMEKKFQMYVQQEQQAMILKNQALGWKEATKHMKQILEQ